MLFGGDPNFIRKVLYSAAIGIMGILVIFVTLNGDKFKPPSQNALMMGVMVSMLLFSLTFALWVSDELERVADKVETFKLTVSLRAREVLNTAKALLGF
jgi:hypothetical protein